ncbi:hypothetical protein JKF63_03348 [Porcisia hertigi]|uniref:DUF7630 domain-containing protein n=1 Tax=Porcisia hertigi TaxID=2761500 RepID=A0A836I222_9TRYP|nr:hypothetical protein JKF63_03348 [Porcisia hertigi]
MISEDLLQMRAATLVRSTAVELTQVANTACNVAGMVVGDDAPQQAYIVTICPSTAAVGGAEVVRTSLVQVRLGGISSAGGSGVALVSSTTLRQRYATPTSREADEEEVMSLVFVNETRLLHIALRRPDATITVETYTAFGLTAVKPSIVDAVGGTTVQLSGYGFLPGLMCVFGGSADAVVAATVANASAAVCVVPAFSETVCRPYPVAVRLSYTAPWALPSLSPLHAARSPFTAALLQLPTPVIENATATSTGGPHTESGTNESVILRGGGFVESDVSVTAGLNPLCRFWTPHAAYNETITAVASFVNATAVSCLFNAMPMLPPPSFISLSMDGTVFSTTAVPFSVLGAAVALTIRVLAANVTSGRSSCSVIPDSGPSYALPRQRLSMMECTAVAVTNAGIPTISSNPISSLPPLEVFFIDSVGNRVSPRGGDEGRLQAFVSIAGHVTDPSSDSADLTESSAGTIATNLELEGRRLVAFDAEGGVATLSGLSLRCPPIGRILLRAQVVQGFSFTVSSLFTASNLWINIVEGTAYRTAFVGDLSTTYYPDWTLLRHQAVIAVQDECLNIFRTLDNSVLPGALTVQLYSEHYRLLPTGHKKGEGAVPHGNPWTLTRPLNNMFYLTNISLPAASFNTWYYITITSDLPQSRLWSKAIEMLPCEPGRRSVLHTVEAEMETPGKGSTVAQRISCDRCPPHGVCNGSSIVTAEDGYWRLDAAATNFISCSSVYGAAEACERDGQCADGYEGLLCGACARGYHKFGRTCRKCLPKKTQYFLIFLMAVVTVGALTCVVVGLALMPPSPLLVVAARSLVLAVQVLSLFSYITPLWPRKLEDLFNALSAMADFPQTLLSCDVSAQGYSLFMCGVPLVLIPLVTALSGLWLRLLKQHRANPHIVCAIVLAALLHRKQERFHVLRHTIARRLWGLNSHHNARASAHHGADTLMLHTSASPQMRHTRPSDCEGTQSIPFGSSNAARGTLPSVTSLMRSVECTFTEFRPTTSLAVSGRLSDMEGFVLNAFALQAIDTVKALVACHPGASEEQTVVSAVEQKDERLLKAVASMSVPLVALVQVKEWTQYALDVEAALPGPGEASDSSPMSVSGAPGFDVGRSAYSGAESLPPQGPGGTRGSLDRCTSPITWKRVGMISAYRAIAVHQFRASCTALLLSTTCVTLVCLYLHLPLHALLWQRCVSLDVGVRGAPSGRAIPSNGASLLCDSTVYFLMRSLGIVMIIIYGVSLPLGLGGVAMWLKMHYGKDAAHSALPAMLFGHTTLDLFISLWNFVTVFAGSVAVTQTSAPMLQAGALVAVLGLWLVINSVWRVSGPSCEVQLWIFAAPLRGVITAALVMVFVLVNILLLLLYGTLSDSTLTVAVERGLALLTVIAITLVCAMLLAVTLHQVIMHLQRMRESRIAAVQSTAVERQTLQALVRRYRDTCHTIQLYLEACDRGLLVAQKLDALSRNPLAAEEDPVVAADDEDSLNLCTLSEVRIPRTRSSTPSSRTITASAPGSLSRAKCRRGRQRRAARRLSSDSALGGDAHLRSHRNLKATQDLPRSTSTPLFPSDRVSAVSRHKPAKRHPPSSLSAALRCSNVASTPQDDEGNLDSGAENKILRTPQSMPLCVHDSIPHCAPLSAPNYPDGRELCVPADGNDYWMPSHQSGAEEFGAAAATTATTTGSPPRQHHHQSAGMIAAVEVIGAPSTTGDVAGASKERVDTATSERVTASSTPITSAAQRSSESFSDVTLPRAQPTQRRSDSLLISIRSLDSRYSAEAQAARVALERGTLAVTAGIAKHKEPRQLRPSALSSVSGGVQVGGSEDAAGFAEGKVPVTTQSGGVARPPQRPPGATTPSSVFDDYAASIELDLASSFDPLTVPPLPLTRVLDRAGMTSSRQQSGWGRVQTTLDAADVLAALRHEMNLQVRQFEADVSQDRFQGIDLGKLFSADSSPEGIITLAGVLESGATDVARPPAPLAALEHRRGGDMGRATAGVAHSTSVREATGIAGSALGAGGDRGQSGRPGGSEANGGGVGLTVLPVELSERAAEGSPTDTPPDGMATNAASVLPLPVFRPVSQQPQAHNQVTGTHSRRRLQPTVRHAPSPRSGQRMQLWPNGNAQSPVTAPTSVKTGKSSAAKKNHSL